MLYPPTWPRDKVYAPRFKPTQAQPWGTSPEGFEAQSRSDARVGDYAGNLRDYLANNLTSVDRPVFDEGAMAGLTGPLFGAEVAAGLPQLFGAPSAPPEMTAGERFRAGERAQHRTIEEARQRSPFGGVPEEMAGGLINMPLSGGSYPGIMAEGMLYGGLHGAGTHEDNRLANAATEAAMGSVFGPLLKGALHSYGGGYQGGRDLLTQLLNRGR